MRASLETVYRRHRQGLFTLALSITRRPSQAEDAIQEAFARLWKTRARPQGDIVAYVFAAVRNAAIEQCRGRRPELRGQVPPVSIYDGRAVDPAAAAMDAEQMDAARRALDSLPDDQREVVVMRIYGGLKFAQIAEALGRPMPTITTRYRRALAKLQTQMRRDYER